MKYEAQQMTDAGLVNSRELFDTFDEALASIPEGVYGRVVEAPSGEIIWNSPAYERDFLGS